MTTTYVSEGDSATPTFMNTLLNAVGKEIFNVKASAYGALGDGSNNDTAPIQTALNAANTVGGGVVYLPPGTYRIATTQLDIPSNTHLVGAGPGSTTITQATADVNGVRFNGVTDASIRDLTIEGLSSTSPELSNVLIQANSQRILVKNVVCNDVVDSGIRVNSCTDVWIEDCVVNGPTSQDNGIEIIETARTLVRGCVVTNATTNNYRIVGSTDTQIIGCRSIDGSAGIRIEDGGGQDDARTVCIGNFIEGATTGISINGCHGGTIIGNSINGTSGDVGIGMVDDINDTIIANNNIHSCGRGFDIRGTTVRNLIQGNIINDAVLTGGSAYGFYINATSADDLLIKNNHVNNNSAVSGDTLQAVRVFGNATSSVIQYQDNHHTFAASSTPVLQADAGIFEIRTNAPITTLADDATPTVRDLHIVRSGGTTTITDFDNGEVGQELVFIADHSITITHGASTIVLNGGANFAMASGDTLTLRMFDDGVWTEVARSDNTP